MATIFNPANTPIISKIQLGSQLYYLTDAEARALLEQLGTAAKKNVADGVSASDQGLVTGAQVAEAISNISGAMHFRGVVVKEDEETDISALTRVITDPAAGDVAIVGVKEYVYGGEPASWHELGDESIYALKSTTIAGLALSSNISVESLQNALGLKALAYKDSASGTVAGQTISGVKATGTSTGSISVVLDQNETTAELTKADYTPEGTITGSVVATGSVSIAKSAENGTQISGSISAPDITVTPATASVQYIDSVGTQATFTEGAFHEGAFPTLTNGAQASWSASVTDDVLSFSWTTNTLQALQGGTLPSKDADSFTANALPTKTEATTVVTGIAKAEATAPTFTGDKFAATFTGNQEGDSISANFTGTKAAEVLVTGVKYEKAAVNTAGTKFTGSALELDVGDIAVAAKDVTVS